MRLIRRQGRLVTGVVLVLAAVALNASSTPLAQPPTAPVAAAAGAAGADLADIEAGAIPSSLSHCGPA